MAADVEVSDGDNETSGAEDDDEIGDLRQQFHNTVREHIIFLLFFLTLITISWTVVTAFLKKKDKDGNLIPPPNDEDESAVYRICFLMCVLSLSISIGATLLLPISIVSNEVLLLYPQAYYVKWLNSMLIQGLWNLIFIFANFALFLFLPLAYFLIEAEGFSGHKKGVWGKIYEAFVVLMLVGVTIWGIAYVLGAVLSPERTFTFGILNQLPFVYSCISFLGVLLLLAGTPFGFGHLFTVVSQLMVGPEFLTNLEEAYELTHLKVEALKNKYEERTKNKTAFAHLPNFSSPPLVKPNGVNGKNGGTEMNGGTNGGSLSHRLAHMIELIPNFADQTDKDMKKELDDLQMELSKLYDLKRTPRWKRNILYPLAFIFLMLLTALTVFMVILNALQLIFGIKALPTNAQSFSLGLSSMSVLGSWGAGLEIVLILYLMATSLIGLYNLPKLRNLRPRLADTSTSLVIYNCGFVLILSSALPVLARILGITNFDLMGNYGKIEWLGNFYVVLFYNLFFSVAATCSLMNKFTLTIRQELVKRLQNMFSLKNFKESSSESKITLKED